MAKKKRRAKHVPPILRHNLTAWIKSKGYTKSEVAFNFDVSSATLHRWLTGKPISGPRLKELRSFCKEHDILADKPIKFKTNGEADKSSCPCDPYCACDSDDPGDCPCYVGLYMQR